MQFAMIFVCFGRVGEIRLDFQMTGVYLKSENPGQLKISNYNKMNKSLCKIVSATSRSAFLQFRGQKCCETSIIIQSKTSSSSQHFSISSCPSIISQSAAIKSSSASSFLSRSLIQKRHLFIQTSGSFPIHPIHISTIFSLFAMQLI